MSAHGWLQYTHRNTQPGESNMNGFNVFYVKSGQRVTIFAATDREAKTLMIAALRDPSCSGIGVRPAA